MKKYLKYLGFMLIAIMVMATAISLVAFIPAAEGATSIANADTSSLSVWDGTSSDTSWYNNHTAVFEINSAAQLAGFCHLTSSGVSFSGTTVKLAVNIDLGGNKWIPITGFAGTFDGQNHTIKNGVLKYTGEGVGFFGNVTSVIMVKNVVFEAISTIDGDFGVGIVIGNNTADGTTIDNVTVKNCSISTFNTSSFDNYNGFIVAINENNMVVKNSTVIGCSFSCNGLWRNYIGCIFGSANYNSSATTSKIYNCSVYDCTFGGPEYNYERVGLIAARNSGTTIVDGFNTNLICVQNSYNLFGYGVTKVKLANIDFGFTFIIDDVNISQEYADILTDYSSITGNYILDNIWGTQSAFTNSATSTRFLEKGGLTTANNLLLSFSNNVTSASATANGSAVNTLVDGKNVNVALNGAVGNTTVLVTIGGRTHQFNFKTSLFEKKTGTVISDTLSYNLAAMGNNPWIIDGDVYKSNSAGLSNSENGMAFYSEGVRYFQFDGVSSSETNYDFINLYIDGEKYEKFVNGSGTTLASSSYATYTIDFGDTNYHEIIFAFRKDSGGNVGNDVACIKNVTQPSIFEGIPSVSLLSSGVFYTETTVEGTYVDVPAALYKNDTIPEGTSLTYCTETTNPWTCGADAEYWASNNATQNSSAMTSSITFKSNGSKYLSFKIACPGEFSSTWGKIYDFATVAIDGVGTNIIATSRFTIADGIPWQNYYCEFEDNGEHIVTVVFHQDDGNSSPYCALIKDFARDVKPTELSIKVQIEGLGSVYVDNGLTATLCDSAETVLKYPFTSGYEYASGNGTSTYFFNPNNIYSISFEAVAGNIMFDGSKYITPYYKEVLISDDNGLSWKTYTNEEVANGALELDLVSDYIIKFVFDTTEQLPVIAIENEGTLYIANDLGTSIINKTVHMYDITEVGKFLIGKNVTVTAPYIEGVSCSVKIGTAESVVLSNDNVDKGTYFYNFKLTDLTSITDIAFIYSADGYTSSEFKHSILVLYNIDTDLVLSTSLEVEIINDTSLPYEYDLTHSDTTHKAFKSGNSANGLNLSISTIGFRASASGLLTIDVFISTESYISLSDNSYATRDFVVFSYTNPLTLASDGWIKSAEKSSQTSASCGGTETYGCIENDITKASGNIGWKTITFPVTANDVIYLSYYKNIDTADFDDTFAVSNVSLRQDNANILYSAQNGTVESTAIGKTDIEGGINVPGGTSVTLTATATDDYIFRGWYNTNNNQLVSSNLSYTFNCVGNASYKALFTYDDNYIRIGGTAFDTLFDALKAAAVNDIVYVNSNYIITENIDIPEGVTVLLPYTAYDSIGTAVGTTSTADTRVSWTNEAKYLYKILTIDSGVTLTVNGSLIVGGVQHYPDQFAQGHTSGAYSQIINNGNIVINGSFDNRGRITGDGVLTTNGSLKTPFMVNNYAGGTNTENHYNAGYFPFVQFATVNIECDQVVNYGAKVIGSTSLYFWSSINTQDIVLIDKIENKGSEGALIWMEAGSSLNISYNTDKAVKQTVGNINLTDSGVTTITVNGAVTAGEFAIGVDGVVYGSGNMVLALPYTYNIIVADGGTLNIAADRQYMVMPGAVLTVNDGGSINVNGGLYVLDGLIQADKSGKSYPSYSVLNANGFSQSGTFIINGNVTVAATGTFAGIAQTSGNTGVLQLMTGATVTKTLTMGSTGGYTNDQTVLTLTARVYGLYAGQIHAVEAGKSYRAYANTAFTLPSFTMDSAARMDPIYATINQAMTGAFGEKVNDSQVGVYTDISIGEAVADVQVNISGTAYTTNDSGIIENAYVIFNVSTKEFNYYTIGKQTNSYTGTYLDNLVLTKVIKDASLATDNIYTQVLNENGNVSTAFVLYAVLNYYGGGTSEKISVSGSFDNSKYVCSVTLKNDTYSDCNFIKTLKQAPATFALHQLDVTALADYEGTELIEKATAAYNNYLALKDGRSGEEIDFLDEQMADYDDFYKIVKSISVTAATYGDANGTATATYIDGTTASINVAAPATSDGYSYASGNISATYTYTGTYEGKTYIVTADCNNVDQRKITVTVEDKTAVYGNDDTELSATITGGIIGDDVAYTLARTPGSNAGTYKITGAAASYFYTVSFTYTNATEKHSVYTITEREITVTIDNQESTYGDAIVALTASVTAGNIVNGDNASDIYTLAKADGTDVVENGYAITGTDISTNYKVTFVEGVYTISPRATNVTVANHSNVMLSKTDNIKFSATRSYDNVVLTNITFSIKQSDVLIAMAAADGTITVVDGQTFGIGTYDVTANYFDANYNISSVKGTIEIVADNDYYKVDPGFINNASKTYDGTAFSFTVIVKINETQEVLAINTDYTVSIKKNGADTVTEIKYVGAYEVKISITGENIEYTYDYTVNTREITVTIDDQESIYGDAIKTLTASVTSGNIVNGDNASDIYTLAKADGTDVAENGYAITGTDISTNYKVTFVDGVYTITEREITVTIDNQESTYGDAIVALTASVTAGNILDGDNASDIYTLAKADGTDVVENGYAITGSDISNNYKVTFVNGVYTITERPITVTIDNQESTYGDAIVALTASITSGELVIGDSKDSVYTLAKADGTDVAENGYAITGSDISNNYKVTFVNGVYTINARKITITADNKTSIFGDNLVALTAQLTSGTFAGDDDVYSVCEFTKAAGVAVQDGGYAITGTSKNANYDITFTAGTYTITARPVTVKINDASSIYGDVDADLTATLADGSTLADDDEIDAIINIARAAGAGAGTYDITASPVDNANYNVTIVYTGEDSSVYTVEQRPITITVDSSDAVNSAATWAEIVELFGYRVTEGTVVNNDDLHVTFDVILSTNVTLTESNFTKQFTGGEHIIKGYYDNANYDVTIIDGTLTVTKPMISVKNIVTIYTYTGFDIAVFDWEKNLSGYLASANENSFKATYYFGEEEILVDGVKNAGTYKMVISIVHTYAYEFESDAVLTYTLTVEKKDISDKISIVGFEDAGTYASVQAIIAMVDGYDVITNGVLTKAGTEVELPVAEPGNYTYTATIDDANYKGSASASFRLVPDVANKITAITTSLEAFGSADDDEKVAALLAIRDNIRVLTADDYILIAADDDYAQLIEDCKKVWADYLAESEEEFNVADKAAHSNLPAAVLTLISAMSAAAWFSFKKFLL